LKAGILIYFEILSSFNNVFKGELTSPLKTLLKELSISKYINIPAFKNDNGGYFIEILNPLTNKDHDSGNIFIDDDIDKFSISFGMSTLEVEIDEKSLFEGIDKVITFVKSVTNKNMLSFQAIGEFGTSSGYYNNDKEKLISYIKNTYGNPQAIYTYIWGEKDSKRIY
jgi:hypothetical protein